MTHTPGPWRVDRENVGEGRIITDANGVKVASTSIVVSGIRSIDKAEAIANAAHIVKCVNDNPALIAERDRLREALLPFSFCSTAMPPPGVTAEDWTSAVLAAREAVNATLKEG